MKYLKFFVMMGVFCDCLVTQIWFLIEFMTGVYEECDEKFRYNANRLLKIERAPLDGSISQLVN